MPIQTGFVELSLSVHSCSKYRPHSITLQMLLVIHRVTTNSIHINYITADM